jgi:hypothetical protein
MSVQRHHFGPGQADDRRARRLLNLDPHRRQHLLASCIAADRDCNADQESLDPNHVHYWAVLNPNPPAVIIKAGATLQLSTPSSTSGSIGSYSADSGINLGNFRVDGTLVLESGPSLNMRVLSGTGVTQRPPAGAAAIAVFAVGDNPFSGGYSRPFGGYFGNDHVIFSMPNATIFSNESFITCAPQAQFGDTATHELKCPQTIWKSHYGDDINTDSGLVLFSGLYSYSNSGNRLKLPLSDSTLNSMLVKNVAGSLTGGSSSSSAASSSRAARASGATV